MVATIFLTENQLTKFRAFCNYKTFQRAKDHYKLQNACFKVTPIDNSGNFKSCIERTFFLLLVL